MPSLNRRAVYEPAGRVAWRSLITWKTVSRTAPSSLPATGLETSPAPAATAGSAAGDRPSGLAAGGRKAAGRQALQKAVQTGGWSPAVVSTPLAQARRRSVPAAAGPMLLLRSPAAGSPVRERVVESRKTPLRGRLPPPGAPGKAGRRRHSRSWRQRYTGGGRK